MRALLALTLLASATALTAPAAGREQIPAEAREIPWTGRLPACDDPAVLSHIASNFASKEANYWRSSLRIDSFVKVRPLAWRPWGADYIPRQFCSALALVSDGHERPVHYSMREDLGPIGIGWNVQWCVTGLDRNWAYAPWCKEARP
ncbi:hypothetical protein QNA08_13620 [Chelatococcus sp. SYSU_G07232]|uniref:Cytoplasmic protein n=1 Tax=Chelatococcus albus TaxID=3047466 RepID=A0ABT7AIT5_9HYPH|nr:hypothetical protein [Chelatococcus sp. SYSU_G07232]MDJ1159274.1 hypothetical protein [Chelatococcus sp. SYSU_G07232]